MAVFDCRYFSETLGLNTAMTVIVPQRASGQIGLDGVSSGDAVADTGWPTLWLLHGLSDDHTIWLRRTSLERYVSTMKLAVVIPNVHRSFYTDMAHGGRYWTFVSEELPRVARSFFPLSAKREHNFAAGLSMGGYGAFKLALAHPDRYAAGASLSGALDRTKDTDHDFNIEEALRLAFGDISEFRGSENDLLHLADQMVERGGERPVLYQCCGTADFLYDQNQSFLNHARSLGVEVLYEDHEGAAHTWDYWDQQIRRVLQWLPLADKGEVSV